MAKSNSPKNYGNDSISSLKGADRVRKRPAVIFGSDGLEGCEHAVFEILSNAIDEAREGHGSLITVTRYEDHSIEVEDFGRGCPVDWNEKEQKFNWELVFCELYAGGKYNNNDGDNYEYSLGLNGLGSCATQYASAYFDAVIHRDGFEYTLHFEKGIPTAVDGKEMGAVELVEYLNKVGGENGIGLLDIVENRLVGMKSRGVYETPGGAILYKAINVLETITLDKESAHFKAQLAQKYADIVYNGQWFTPLREALDAFADSLEKTVTGDVKLKLYKGNMINAGVTSPYTLYDEQTASFGVDKDYDQSDATGFINLFGLSIKERAKLSKNWPEVKE